MNNDILSIRKTPLKGQQLICLKTRNGYSRPARGSILVFYNTRLKRAWRLKVRTHLPNGNDWLAVVQYGEADYDL